MVSPYKKKKLERRSRATGEQTPVKNNAIKKSKPSSIKPLTDKKFYLDIRNHASLKKIEGKLTVLGAKLELFLIKSVDYVITDREDYHPTRRGGQLNTPTPSPFPSFCSVSPATTDSPTDGVISNRARSRAETMLDRVRHQPLKTTGDILDNAIAWRIPIYPLQRFITWLDKVSKRAERLSSDSRLLVGHGGRELRGPYLKLETTARPEFKEFSVWPTLGLTRLSSQNGNDTQRMTRKVNKTVKEASSAPGGGNGYCEMCRVHYDQLDTHIVSVQHSKLVTDPAQYSHLDSIISQHNLGDICRVATLRKSLRIAKSPPPYLPPEMGGKQSSEAVPPSTPTMTRQSSPLCIAALTTPKMNGHVTRSVAAKGVAALQPRVNLGTPVPLRGVNCNGIERRSSNRRTPKEKTPSSGNDSSGSLHEEKSGKIKKLSTPPPVLTPMRQVTPSPPAPAATCIIEHNLRSRRCQVIQSNPASDHSATEKMSITKSPASKSSVGSKTTPLSKSSCSARLSKPVTSVKSALSAKPVIPSKPVSPSKQVSPAKPPLSARAVSSPAKVTSVVKPVPVVKSQTMSSKVSSPPLPSLPPPPLPAYPSRRLARKRLSVEEKLIEDNKSYYKVEVLNSKLRSTEFFISQKQVEERVNGNTPNSTLKSPDDVKPVVVRFKKVRKSELAVLSDEAESFMFGDPRRDREDEVSSEDSKDEDEVEDDEEVEEEEEEEEESEEDQYRVKKKIKLENSSDNLNQDNAKATESVAINEDILESLIKDEDAIEMENKVMFSFEMKPRRELWMDTYQRQAEGNEFYIPQHHNYPGAVLPYELPPDVRRRMFKRKERLSKVHQLHDDKPRKSPRCHASTLAIMSSLLSRRRPLRECSDKPVNYDEESSLTETVASSGSGCSLPRCRVAELIASVCAEPKGDAIAEALLNGAESLDLEPGECLSVDPSCIDEAGDHVTRTVGLDVSLEWLITTFNECTSIEVEEYAPPQLRYFDGLRYSNIDSCASSECSDFFGFLDDGRVVSKKRKKKRRNMTGWPSETKPKKKVAKDPPCLVSMNSMTDYISPSIPNFPSSPLGQKRSRGRPRKNPHLITYLCPPTLTHTTPLGSASSPLIDRQSEDEPLLRKRKLSRFFPNRFK